MFSQSNKTPRVGVIDAGANGRGQRIPGKASTRMKNVRRGFRRLLHNRSSSSSGYRYIFMAAVVVGHSLVKMVLV
jgi:hypothetical protein